MNAKELWGVAEQLFTKRTSLMMLWQEMAENFYPERADFTYTRTLGTDFAGNLMTSYPIICRRELGDQIGQMLRPTAKQWSHISPIDSSRETNKAKRWLQWSEGVMRRAMYDKKSLFTRAAKEADHDYACFGQSVTSVKLNRNADALLYQTWHLRDVVWQENAEGIPGLIARKWKPEAREMKRLFPGKIHLEVEKCLMQNKPFQEFECVHFIVEAEMYDQSSGGKPFFSVYYDVANDHIMEAVAVWNKEYNVARWQTVSGSQYAFSPATVCALPDARLLQSMTYTLLEAGEKIASPPLVATQDVVRSDVDVRAGGIVWVDRDYDERLGDALRPITQDARGLPFGVEMQDRVITMLNQAFYLNKLNLPQRAPEMTAYEVGQRIQEYIRGALPIFEPMEMERNGGDCELTFDILLRNGAFGSPADMPEELRGAELQFRFESPLHDAIEQQKSQKFLEMAQFIAQAVQLDQSVAAIPDSKVALRDVLMGIGVPAKWLRDEVTVEQIEQQQQATQQAAEMMGSMQAGSEVAVNLSQAQKNQAEAQPV